MRLYTARFSNPSIGPSGLTPVRITRYPPRFRLRYKLAATIMELAPPADLLRIEARAEFEPRYFDHLGKVGIAAIRNKLEAVASGTEGRDIVLLCFERVEEQTGNPGDWCHRRCFAAWWEKMTGERVEELSEAGDPPYFFPSSRPSKGSWRLL